MKRAALGLVAALMALWPVAGVTPAAAGVDTIAVTADPVHVETAVGGRFTLSTQLTNHAEQPTGTLIAHLNVASLTPGVYVDPEDWSSERTQRVGSLASGQSAQLTWQLQAVNAGTFDAYVVLLPTQQPGPASPLAVSRSVLLRVASRQTLSAGGVLPIVIAVPVLLVLLVILRTRAARQFR